MRQQTDIIVIGGGIAGISAAAEIAAGAQVIVLETEAQIGYHATGRSAAIFIRNYGNAVLRALNEAAYPVFLNPDKIADGTLLSPRGLLQTADPGEMPELEAYIAGSSGIDRLGAAEACALVPILRPEKIAEAIYEPDAQAIDVDLLLQGYARLLKSRGGEVMTGAQVTGLRHDGAWQVMTSQGEFTAPVVVNAAGAWADQIAQMAGLPALGLTPMRRSAAIIPAPDGHDVEHWPLFGSVSETWYAKPEAGKLMVSPADEDPVEAQDAWADDMVLAEGLHRYEQAVNVPVTRVEHSWAGLRTFAPDRTPVVGRDSRNSGFFWLAGQGGYGVQTAPAMARLAAALLLDQRPALAPETINALRADRFTRG